MIENDPAILSGLPQRLEQRKTVVFVATRSSLTRISRIRTAAASAGILCTPM